MEMIPSWDLSCLGLELLSSILIAGSGMGGPAAMMLGQWYHTMATYCIVTQLF